MGTHLGNRNVNISALFRATLPLRREYLTEQQAVVSQFRPIPTSASWKLQLWPTVSEFKIEKFSKTRCNLAIVASA